MESNHTKQTLQTAMENEQQHLSLSDSDSTDSETDKAIIFSSPARFHSASDSDDSAKSNTDKATNPNSTTANANGAVNTNSTKAESQPSSSISSDSNDFTKSGTDKASESIYTTAIAHPTVNRDSTKVSSPPRSSISSDQISLPHESFTLEDNKHSAAPTGSPPEKPPIPEAVVKKFIKEEPLALVKADLFVGDGTASVKEGEDGGNRRRRGMPQLSILRKVRRDEMVKKAGLGFRIFGFLFCLASFSVMAADRNKGWALDSFERYKEFRYCMSVNVIGFVYSGAQAFDLAYQSATGKNIVQHHLRYMFDFALDQVVTYLLISASSSAATRIDDWQSNWGKDKFPDMASASVALSFLSFAALAFSSLISGYVLCNSRST
ncbi:CASP-like protein 4A3 [Solanum stenotomum]|uniref:CASP-like protein 4A3 n=1 Tax=Solanum stenotomum TaxID=172797 RepID=UPI0020D031C7|nr:CASP-like protein 4A3 [Solanum stenotomum]